jgi:hypothetical protein
MNKLLILLSMAFILLIGCKDVRDVSIIDPYNSVSSGRLAKTTDTPLIDNDNLTYTQSFSVNGISDESMKFNAIFAQGSSFGAELKMKKGITPGNYSITFDAKNLMLDIIAEDGSPASFNIPPTLSLTYNQIIVNTNEINTNDAQFYCSGSFIVPGGKVSLDHSNTFIKVSEAQINVGNYGFRPMDAKHYLKHIVIDGSNGTKLTYQYIYPDGTVMKATLNALKGSFSGAHNFDLDFSIENLSLNLSSTEVTEFAIPLELSLQFENPNNSYQDLINKYDPQFYKITGDYKNYVKINNCGVKFNDNNNKISVNKAQLNECSVYGFDMDKLDYLYQYTSQLTILNSKGGNITFKYTYPDGAVLSASLKIAKGSFNSMGKESVTFWIDFDRANNVVEFSPSGSNFDIPIELDLTYDLSKSTNPTSPLFNLNTNDVTYTCFDDGTLIPYKNLNIDSKAKKIEIQGAQIPHFSRYGWSTKI